jgi:hypothetical protein
MVLHRTFVRALLRVALLSIFIGALPPAAAPVALAAPVVAGPPAANAAPPAATPQPTPPKPISSTPVPHPELSAKLRAGGASALPATTPDLSKQTLAFIPNKGQTDAAVRFHVRSLGGGVFFTNQEIVFAVPSDRPASYAGSRNSSPDSTLRASQPITLSLVRMRYEGSASNPSIAAADRLPGTANFIIGDDPTQWHTDIPTYAGIVYQQLYGVSGRRPGPGRRDNRQLYRWPA